MLESFHAKVFLLVFGLMLMSLGFFLLGQVFAPSGKAWQREAVLKGHAIWAADKDGAPVFQWKPIGGER
jgi:hypothetical protein